ncbi:hypothetical protein SO694_00019244 [Aureococcus anophagefferens]|uniref:Secreted protein n=1 Tax=Aureococcus anophagefferens TaxID=44056 RepID=A0ABR1G018_AURAN
MRFGDAAALVAAVAWPYGGLRVVRAWRRVKGTRHALLDAACTARVPRRRRRLAIMVASPDNAYVDVPCRGASRKGRTTTTTRSRRRGALLDRT